MSAAMDFDLVEEIAGRLDPENWTSAPDGIPKAAPFLTIGAEGQANRLVVYPLNSAPADTLGGRGPVVQVVTTEIGVLLLLPRRNDRGGRRARANSGTFIKAIRQRLLGRADPAQGNVSWTPDGLKRPLVWRGGAIVDVENDSYWHWLDRYAAEWRLDSQKFNSA